MGKKVIILGGYGGVGKVLSRELLRYTDADITISGRNPERCESLAGNLGKEFPGRNIQSVFADATSRDSLVAALKDMDLLIVAATVPDNVATIAEAAIETGTDMVDILVRGDVVDTLSGYRDAIVSNNRIFITQAGFHPGLPAPLIKYARHQFDEYHTANVVMVMNSRFEKPESTHEIIHEIGASDSRILKNGIWRKSTYRDAIEIEFSDDFGKRKCYPLQMKEVYPLAKELGIRNMGVYSAGFNAFVDNIVFPLTMLVQSLKKGMGTRLCGRLMHWGINRYFDGKPGVEFRLVADGIKDGHRRGYVVNCRSADAFEFTALSVIACLKQYLDGAIDRPDLYLMGNIVDEIRIIDDLRKMGVRISEETVSLNTLITN